MNTRLQVEHPVTEEITGLDLVEQMIRVAAGEKLEFTQDDVRLERLVGRNARLCRGPVPQLPAEHRAAGPLLAVRIAAAREKDLVVRVDDGVADGGEVSMFYDPMIAKLITWAPTRIEAIDAQVARARPVRDRRHFSDNVDFLSALMQHPRFRAGDITTGFIAEEYPEGFDGAPADEQLIEDLTAIAGMVAVITDERAAEISDQLGPPPHFPCERVVCLIGGEKHKVRIKPYKGGTLAVTDDGDLMDIVGRWVPGQRLLSVSSTAASASSRSAASAATGSFRRAGATPQGAGAQPPHVADLVEAHDREGAARPVAAAARADAGAADQARRRGRRQGRARPAGRGDGSDEDGEYPPRAQGGDGQGDPGQGGRQPRGRSGHRGV